MTPTNVQPSIATTARVAQSVDRLQQARERVAEGLPRVSSGAISLSIGSPRCRVCALGARRCSAQYCTPRRRSSCSRNWRQIGSLGVLGGPHWRDWQTASAIVPRPAQISRTPRACATGCGGGGAGAAALARALARLRVLLGLLRRCRRGLRRIGGRLSLRVALGLCRALSCRAASRRRGVSLLPRESRLIGHLRQRRRGRGRGTQRDVVVGWWVPSRGRRCSTAEAPGLSRRRPRRGRGLGDDRCQPLVPSWRGHGDTARRPCRPQAAPDSDPRMKIHAATPATTSSTAKPPTTSGARFGAAGDENGEAASPFAVAAARSRQRVGNVWRRLPAARRGRIRRDRRERGIGARRGARIGLIRVGCRGRAGACGNGGEAHAAVGAVTKTRLVLEAAFAAHVGAVVGDAAHPGNGCKRGSASAAELCFLPVFGSAHRAELRHPLASAPPPMVERRYLGL